MLDQAERLRQMAKGDKGPKIITITSGKGGVGKSNLVVNLALALQKRGNKVMVFDADIGMANDDILMGFSSKNTIFDIIYQNKSIEEVVMDGPLGVKLLPGGSGLNKLDELDEYQREKFLKNLGAMSNLDYILMDTGAGINRSVLSFIACCQELILVLTPEPTSLTDGYSLIKAVDYFKVKNKAKIVVNRELDKKEGQDTFKKFKNAVNKFLNIEIEYLGGIGEDRKLVEAVRSQSPLILSSPESRAAKDIDLIADKLLGKDELSNDGMGLQGFFKKIFNIFS